jgi:metal-sulfur cluster biosynthetic enzyme
MSEDDVRAALKTVEDPEAGMDIVELGLVYAIEAGDERIRVEMTMTSPACPAAPYLVDEATAAIRAVAPADADVQVELVWEPPWTPDRMSDEAKARFGWT